MPSNGWWSFRFHPLVFIAPPWPEIFRQDAERRHGFKEASASYEPVRLAYLAAGYETVELPKKSVEDRAEFILRRLAGR